MEPSEPWTIFQRPNLRCAVDINCLCWCETFDTWHTGNRKHKLQAVNLVNFIYSVSTQSLAQFLRDTTEPTCFNKGKLQDLPKWPVWSSQCKNIQPSHFRPPPREENSNQPDWTTGKECERHITQVKKCPIFSETAIPNQLSANSRQTQQHQTDENRGCSQHPRYKGGKMCG